MLQFCRRFWVREDIAVVRTVSRWLFHERRTAVECALLLDRAGADADFSDAVMTLLERYVGVDHFSLFVKGPCSATRLLAAGNLQRDGLAMVIARAYTERHSRWDPVPSDQAKTTSQDGLNVWRRRAAEVRNLSYRFECYEQPGIAERLTVGYFQCGVWRLLNLYRVVERSSFDDHDVAQALRAAACILPASASRHDVTAPSLTTGQRLTKFRERLNKLPVDLSGREVEVCARALLGMTVAGTALDLGIARTSIATFRKRAYKKLNISSQAELYALLP